MAEGDLNVQPQQCNEELIDSSDQSDPLSAVASSLGLSKKGQPWTEQEHKAFLEGLGKLGRGNWRGISKHFVPSRTPTQVASHAQKHFMRLQGATKRKSRFAAMDHATNRGQTSQDMQHDQSPSKPSSTAPPCPTTSMPYPFFPPIMYAYPGSAPMAMPPPIMCNPQMAAFAAFLAKMGCMPQLPPGFPCAPSSPPSAPAKDDIASEPCSPGSPITPNLRPCKPSPVHFSATRGMELLGQLPASKSSQVQLVPSAHSAFKPLQPIKGC